jgi:hypothetical protein
MKLTDFDNKPIVNATKALKENYNVPFNVNKMNIASTRDMLKKVRGLISETKSSNEFYDSQKNPSYLKLMFMQEALEKHFAELSAKMPKIVVENEEVEKSQTILAAQDMVDSIQKMVEQVSDMIVKELPALVDSVQSEIGVNESTAFQQQAGEALTSLQAALTQSQTTMKEAVNGITGMGGTPDSFETPPMGDMGGDMVPGEEEVDVSADEISAEPEELPEPEPVGGVGRAKR